MKQVTAIYKTVKGLRSNFFGFSANFLEVCLPSLVAVDAKFDEPKVFQKWSPKWTKPGRFGGRTRAGLHRELGPGLCCFMSTGAPRPPCNQGFVSRVLGEMVAIALSSSGWSGLSTPTPRALALIGTC